MCWPVQPIPDIAILTRHCPHRLRKGNKKRKFPGPDHFALRPDEEALSFNWCDYMTPQQHFMWLGLTYKKDQPAYLQPAAFKLFQYPVAVLRQMTGIQKIEHDPVYNGYPAPIGAPNNPAHALVCLDEANDEEVRLKLSLWVNDHYDTSAISWDIDSLETELQALRARGNATCYHQVEDWGNC